VGRARVAAAASCACLLAGASLAGRDRGAALDVPGGAGPRLEAADGTRVVREARYRMSAGIRPLLFFWIRAGNVGGARILWRDGEDGRRGYELLIGSDPRRAPRRINRWGWEREDLGPEGATLFGLMRKTDENSLDEAKAELGREGRGGYVYKVIRSSVADHRVRAENTLLRVPHDYSYRDLAELQALAASAPAAAPRVRQADLPQGTWPGFLFAVADLIDRAVAAAVPPSAPPRLLSDVATTFTFNAALYDLRLRSTQWLDAATYGGRRYERLVRLDLEHHNREKKTRERFVVVCATDGPLARVPVFIEYQPKWWFKAQGVLDESEPFP
jgi:hypothetical protein